MCDFVEAARVLSKAMDDREGASGPAGGEFGVVEADVGDLRVEVLLGDEVGLVFKLAQELLDTHLLWILTIILSNFTKSENVRMLIQKN